MIFYQRCINHGWYPSCFGLLAVSKALARNALWEDVNLPFLYSNRLFEIFKFYFIIQFEIIR